MLQVTKSSDSRQWENPLVFGWRLITLWTSFIRLLELYVYFCLVFECAGCEGGVRGVFSPLLCIYFPLLNEVECVPEKKTQFWRVVIFEITSTCCICSVASELTKISVDADSWVIWGVGCSTCRDVSPDTNGTLVAQSYDEVGNLDLLRT
jgi:hypothetical protein